MLNLLMKDFKLIFSKDRSRTSRITTAILSIVFLSAFVGLEIFIYTEILSKIKDYRDAPQAFSCLLLLVISLLMIVNNVNQAQKLFFNKKDIEQLSAHPIENSALISSKIVLLFFAHYALTFIFAFPILVSYGIIVSKAAIFYYFAIFYPVLTFIFEMGVALLLVYPVWIAKQYLKEHVLTEFIISVVVILGMSYLYSVVLTDLIDLIAQNKLNYIFTNESIASIVKLVSSIKPMNYLINSYFSSASFSIVPYLSISTFLFVVGITVTSLMFRKVINVAVPRKKSTKEATYKPQSLLRAMVVKEMTLYTKSNGFIFSFAGLLVAQPFLLYLLVAAMKVILNSGIGLYYATAYPNLDSFVSVFLVMAFSLIINSGATQYLSSENGTVKNLKTLPISPKKQVIIKAAIPFIMSEASLLISILVIAIGGRMPVVSCIFAFVLTTVLLFIFEAVSIIEELNIRHGKPRSTIISTVCFYAMPLGYLLLSLLLAQLGLGVAMVCLVSLLAFTAAGTLIALSALRRIDDWFMELETT